MRTLRCEAAEVAQVGDLLVAAPAAAATAATAVAFVVLDDKNGSLLRLPCLTEVQILTELHAAPPRGGTRRGICGWEAAEAAPGGFGM